jgi:hypothetical protein
MPRRRIEPHHPVDAAQCMQRWPGVVQPGQINMSVLRIPKGEAAGAIHCIYDLRRAVFPNERLVLKEHFRCVEPIIRFSMQFYPEKMLPLCIPAVHERLDPPLIDIYVPHGARGKGKKINPAEADVIVAEIAALTADPAMRNRTIEVISLIAAEQAEHIRLRLSEVIGDEIMQRHAILCGTVQHFKDQSATLCICRWLPTLKIRPR